MPSDAKWHPPTSPLHSPSPEGTLVPRRTPGCWRWFSPGVALPLQGWKEKYTLHDWLENRKHIFIHATFSIVMLVFFWGVASRQSSSSVIHRKQNNTNTKTYRSYTSPLIFWMHIQLLQKPKRTVPKFPQGFFSGNFLAFNKKQPSQSLKSLAHILMKKGESGPC